MYDENYITKSKNYLKTETSARNSLAEVIKETKRQVFGDFLKEELSVKRLRQLNVHKKLSNLINNKLSFSKAHK